MRVTRMLTGSAVAAVFLSVAASAVAAPSASFGKSTAVAHVQELAISVTPSSMGGVDESVSMQNFAIAPTLPVRITFTNFTPLFHTFTIPRLGISALLRPAHGSTPTKTTLTFTLMNAWGAYDWYCVLCEYGDHGPRHRMSGKVYVILNPMVFAA